MAKNQTPTQKMMFWVLENLKTQLEQDVEKDAELDSVFEKTIDYEHDKMREIFIAGIMLGSGAYQLKKEFDAHEEFTKLYQKMFPDE